MMMNNERVLPTSEYQVDEIVERAFTNIQNKAFSVTSAPTQPLNTSFMESSRNFWLEYEGGKYFQKYSEGVLSGTYNIRSPDFKAISETLLEAFKNILRYQYEQEDKTLMEINPYLQLLEKVFELLDNKLDASLNNKEDGKMIMAYLHAVFNSFITTNMKKRD